MNEPMSEEQLAAIEARANAATPGPWRFDDKRGKLVPGTGDLTLGYPILTIQGGAYPTGYNGIPEDQEFIASAREDVPALVAEVRRLRATSQAGNEHWCEHGHGYLSNREPHTCPHCEIERLRTNSANFRERMRQFLTYVISHTESKARIEASEWSCDQAVTEPSWLDTAREMVHELRDERDVAESAVGGLMNTNERLRKALTEAADALDLAYQHLIEAGHYNAVNFVTEARRKAREAAG
jgi:hypothetical protein